MCKNIFVRNISVHYKFSCVRSSHNPCAHTHVHSLESTLVHTGHDPYPTCTHQGDLSNLRPLSRLHNKDSCFKQLLCKSLLGCGGVAVCSAPFNRRVAGQNLP